MKRMRAGTDVIRVINLINYCNSQVTNVNDQAIIRALFSHASDESEAGPITSLEQIAREANISPASVSRFIRKAGYASFEVFRTSFSRDLEQGTDPVGKLEHKSPDHEQHLPEWHIKVFESKQPRNRYCS